MYVVYGAITWSALENPEKLKSLEKGFLGVVPSLFGLFTGPIKYIKDKLGVGA
jgi:hypothetical protein